MKRAGEAILVLAALLLAWQCLVWLTGAPRYILPGPVAVALAMKAHSPLIAGHALVTVEEVILGLVVGSALGAASALGLVMSRTATRFFLPVTIVSQAIPVFAIAPLLTLWLGYGLWSKVLMAVLIIYFPVASTFLDGLRRTDPGFLDLAQVMGAQRWRTLLRIRLPAALPSLASGLRLAAVYAPIGAVIGEWVGASSGLGYLMLLSNGRAQTDLMFAALLVLAAFTLTLYALVSLAARVLTLHAAGLRGAVRP